MKTVATISTPVNIRNGAVYRSHNHGPTSNPAVHPQHRRLRGPALKHAKALIEAGLVEPVRLEPIIGCCVMAVALWAHTLLGTAHLILQCHRRQQHNLSHLRKQFWRHWSYLGGQALSRTPNLPLRTGSLGQVLAYQVCYLAQDILHRAIAPMMGLVVLREGICRCLGHSIHSFSSYFWYII
jgi:hypothetical protein